MQTDTIAAIASAPGKGGIGIIRISGKNALAIAKQITAHHFKPRYAHYGDFLEQGKLLDRGISLYFPSPHSFTGEDVIELQGHGGPIILDCLLREVVRLGARLAKPGEFSERAFLNDKIDLAQAEAIADLIDSHSEQAARNAVHSLAGDFSHCIDDLVEQTIHLRMFVEAAIDFPEEEIDFLSDGKVGNDLNQLQQQLDTVLRQANQGSLLQEGMTIVIAGKPNAGKSSLMNALAGQERAIVTDIAGTTRDVLKEHIQIDGIPLHIIDTAGLRVASDAVEQIGIERAWDEIRKADRILLMIDSSKTTSTDIHELWPEAIGHIDTDKIILIHNKTDLVNANQTLGLDQSQAIPLLRLSAKHKHGIDELKTYLKTVVGFQSGDSGKFSARRRHLDALKRAQQLLQHAAIALHEQQAGELVAEDLRQCQQALDEITGKFSSDDLLGKIFSSFCIGK
jgi:tRNA modification GTPase